MTSNRTMSLAVLFFALNINSLVVAAPNESLVVARHIKDGTSVQAADRCQEFLTRTEPLTLRALRELAEQATAKLLEQTPAVSFDNIESTLHTERVGDVTAPMALQQVLGPDLSFVSTPAPTSPDPATINLTDENFSFPVHVDIQWQGERESTAAYVTFPGNKTASPGGPIIDSSNKVVVVHLHGGGTPTATGKNAMSIGEKLVGRGVPVVAIDLPGHGLATRRVKGLETMEGQVDWILAMVQKLVAPGVKIVLSGHSWGGEFAMYMWLHGNEPKYKDIVAFMPLAPPIDVSVGGDPHKKLEFGEYWEKNFEQFEARIADSDFEFQKNMLDNGKDSDIGAFFTAFTDFDFSTAPITEEKYASLKPALGFMQEFDGVTYVGREDFAHQIYGSRLVPFTDSTDIQSIASNPHSPSQFFVLGRMTTWKGPNQAQGHNGFDAYIPGSKTPLIYTAMADFAVAQAGGSLPLPETQIGALDYTFRSWSNFPAFRELVRRDVEYVESNSPQAPQLIERRRELDEYLSAVDSELAASTRRADAAAQTATTELRQEVGLKDNVGLKRAQEELSTPEMTATRKAELEAYLGEVVKIETDMRQNFKDPTFDTAVQALAIEFAPLLQALRIATLESYKAQLDRLLATKKLTPEQTKQRGELSRLHQLYLEASKAKQTRFGAEWDRRLALLKAPANTSDYRAAQRELKLVRTPERTAALTAFVARIGEIEAAARVQMEQEVARKLAAIKRPEGANSVDEARVMRAQLDEVIAMTFAPPGNAKLASLSVRLKDATRERDFLISGGDQLTLTKLQRAVDELRIRRASLLRKWDNIWRGDAVTSSRVKTQKAIFTAALEKFKASYFAYEQAKSERLLELKLSGRLTEENILATPDALRDLRTTTQKSKQEFLSAREQLEAIRWNEAAAGSLTGDAKSASDAIAIAREVYGEEFATTGKPSATSLTADFRREDDYLEARRRQLSMTDTEIGELRFQYVTEMQANGFAVPYLVQKFSMFELLNRPLAELQGLIANNGAPASRAMQQMKSKWDEFLGQMRRQNQSKDSGGY